MPVRVRSSSSVWKSDTNGLVTDVDDVTQEPSSGARRDPSTLVQNTGCIRRKAAGTTCVLTYALSMCSEQCSRSVSSPVSSHSIHHGIDKELEGQCTVRRAHVGRGGPFLGPGPVRPPPSSLARDHDPAGPARPMGWCCDQGCVPSPTVPRARVPQVPVALNARAGRRPSSLRGPGGVCRGTLAALSLVRSLFFVCRRSCRTCDIWHRIYSYTKGTIKERWTSIEVTVLLLSSP
jgi:hypothetical protein